MSATASQTPADRYPISFEEFRDAWAAEDGGTGLARLMQKAILRLLNALVALLAESRAGALSAPVPGAEGAASAPCAASALSDADVEAAEAEVCVADADCGVDGGVNSRARRVDGDDGEKADEANSSRADLTRAVVEKPALAANGTGDVLTGDGLTGDVLAGAENAGVAGGASAGGADRDARQTHCRAATPHPPASGPIFASKNGSPSRAPRRSASRPNPARGEGFAARIADGFLLKNAVQG